MKYYDMFWSQNWPEQAMSEPFLPSGYSLVKYVRVNDFFGWINASFNALANGSKKSFTCSSLKGKCQFYKQTTDELFIVTSKKHGEKKKQKVSKFLIFELVRKIGLYFI